MQKPTILAISAVAIGLTVIGLQQGKVSTLRKENTSLRAASATPSRSTRTGNASNSESATGPKEGRAEGVRPHAPGDLAAILAMPDPMGRIRALLAYVDGLAPDEIPAALAELRKGSPQWDPESRMLAHMLLTRLGQEDPDAAFANLDGMDFKRSGGEPASLLASLAALDPQRAAAWLADPDNALAHYPKMGHTLAGTIAREWGRQDPDAALEWARSLPEDQRAGAYTGVLGTLAASDPQRASELAMSLDPGEARRHIMGEIAEAWARTSPDEALDWAQSLGEEEQENATREVLGTWAQEEPASAAAFVDGIIAGGDAYLTEVAANWAPRAPAEAAAWISGQPEGDGKNGAMGHVMWNWTTQDPDAAGEWLGEQAPGPARDAGIGGLVKASFSFDPAAAVNWSNAISDDDRRAGMVNRTLGGWARQDREAAQQWADQNGAEIPQWSSPNSK